MLIIESAGRGGEGRTLPAACIVGHIPGCWSCSLSCARTPHARTLDLGLEIVGPVFQWRRVCTPRSLRQSLSTARVESTPPTLCEHIAGSGPGLVRGCCGMCCLLGWPSNWQAGRGKTLRVCKRKKEVWDGFEAGCGSAYNEREHRG